MVGAGDEDPPGIEDDRRGEQEHDHVLAQPERRQPHAEQVHAQRRVEHRRDGEEQRDEEPVAHVALHLRHHARIGHVVVRMVAMIRGCGWHLVLHPVVLGPHRDGLHIYAVAEVLHPPHWRGHGLVVLLLDLGRLAVAAGLRDDLFDGFRPDPRRVVAHVDHVVLPIEANVGYVRLLSQGSLDSTGAAQAVHATERERATSYGNMLVIGYCRSPGVNIGHDGYLLLSTLHTLSFPMAEVGSSGAASRTSSPEDYPRDDRDQG